MQQSASQLSYKLLTGRTDLKPLRILATRELSWQDWQVSLHVLGMSHAIALRHGTRRVTELLTCSIVEPDRKPRLAMQADPGGEMCAAIGGLICRVRLQPIHLNDGDELEGSYGLAERLEVAFERVTNGVTPVTRIGWQIREGALEVETVHSYPEEGRGVRSWSRFEPAEEQE